MQTAQWLFFLCLFTFLCTSVRAQNRPPENVVVNTDAKARQFIDRYRAAFPRRTKLSGNLVVNIAATESAVARN